jgi:hypothetical protein
MTEEVKCPISGKSMSFVFSEIVLNKYKVKYYYCKESGLLKTETPYWLEEAYQSAISETDVGIAARSIANSTMLEVILECLSISEGQFLDVAGGYGLLTRLMRDKGFDCYSIDKYCLNLFAKAFEPTSNFRADALFAFEVLEHVENPFQFLSEIFEQYGCKTVIISTLTFVEAIPSADWWYYSFESGQHLTFYQPRTLSLLAKRLGCKYYMINGNVHIISDIEISGIRSQILCNKYFRRVYSVYVRFKRKGLTRTWDDFLLVKGRIEKS